ncbi:MAG: hypothetical protein AAF585_16375 [Verrucomicrobiota bacterium]
MKLGNPPLVRRAFLGVCFGGLFCYTGWLILREPMWKPRAAAAEEWKALINPEIRDAGDLLEVDLKEELFGADGGVPNITVRHQNPQPAVEVGEIDGVRWGKRSEVQIGSGRIKATRAQVFTWEDGDKFSKITYSLPRWAPGVIWPLPGEMEPHGPRPAARYPTLRLRVEGDGIDAVRLINVGIYDRRLQARASTQLARVFPNEDDGAFEFMLRLLYWFPTDAILVADVAHTPEKRDAQLLGQRPGKYLQRGRSELTADVWNSKFGFVSLTEKSHSSFWFMLDPLPERERVTFWANLNDGRRQLLAPVMGASVRKGETYFATNGAFPLDAVDVLEAGVATKIERVFIPLGVVPLGTLAAGESNLLNTKVGPIDLRSDEDARKLLRAMTGYEIVEMNPQYYDRMGPLEKVTGFEVVEAMERKAGKARFDHRNQQIVFGGEPSWVEKWKERIKTWKFW